MDPLSLIGNEYDSSSSSSDEEEDETCTGTDSNKSSPCESNAAAAKRKLPSVTSIFETTTKPAFLTKSTKRKAQHEIKEIDKETKKQEKRVKQKEVQKFLLDNAQEANSIMASEVKNQRKVDSMTNIVQREESENKKRNAKERVKTQRMKGQSGIGSDFRSWKSETEMTLRQQFD